MTVYEALDMINHGETTEQYKKRMAKLRRYVRERDDLEDWISVFDECPEDAEIVAKKRERLSKVLAKIEELR